VMTAPHAALKKSILPAVAVAVAVAVGSEG
jgi:hypothetical protein